MMALFSLLLAAVINIRSSAGLEILYQNAGPLDPNSEDLLTNVNMVDNMFIKMDILVQTFPTSGWKYLFFIGDPYARVPDLWLWAPGGSWKGFLVHFSRDGGGQLTDSLRGSTDAIQANTVYTLEVCYTQTSLTSRISGGNINGIYTVTASKKIHDKVQEPVHVGYPNNDQGDADAIITNLYIGSNADCSQPLNLATSAPSAAPTSPTASPTSPTASPTSPTAAPTSPTASPTSPTASPTAPTAAPTAGPTVTPTAAPTSSPTVDCEALDIDGYLSQCSVLYDENVDDFAALEAEIAAINERIDDIVDAFPDRDNEPCSTETTEVGDVIGDDGINDGEESVFEMIFDKYRDYLIVLSLILNVLLMAYIACCTSNNNSRQKYQYHHVKYIDSSENEIAAINM